MDNIQPMLNNKKEITVSILGACILRDAWGFGKEFGEFRINKFIQSNSPFTCFCSPLSEISNQVVSIEDMANTAQSWYKWFFVNAEKTLEQNLAECNNDWLIVGLTEVIDPILKVQNSEGKYTYLDYCKSVKSNNLFENPKFSKLTTEVMNAIDFADSDKVSSGKFKCIAKLGDLIKKYYDPRKVIFVDILPAAQYFTKDNSISSFMISDFEKKCELIEKCSKQFIKDVKPHVIKVPRNVLGDENHKWGISAFHYQPELYEYLLSCFKYIMQNHDDEEIFLNEIYSKLEKYFELKRLYIEELNILNTKYEEFSKKKQIASETENNISETNLELLKKYITARFDIQNQGDKDNSLEFISSSDTNVKYDSPSWFEQPNGKGIFIQSIATSIDFEIKCKKSGILKLWVKGVDIRDKEGTRFPVWINYTSVTVDGESIIDEPKLVCHDKPLIFSKDVSDNQIIKIHAEWKPFDKTALYKNI